MHSCVSYVQGLSVINNSSNTRLRFERIDEAWSIIGEAFLELAILESVSRHKKGAGTPAVSTAYFMDGTTFLM